MLAIALGARIHARPLRIRAQGAHVQQTPHPVATAGLRDTPRQLHVRAGKAVAIGLALPAVQHAHEVDDGAALDHQAVEFGIVVHGEERHA